MELGISTACLYPMKTEEALDTLIDQGFRYFEIFLNSPSELKEDYLGMLSRMLRENGCRVKSIHPFSSGFESFLLFSGYERRFEDGMQFYDRYYAAAERLGAEILVLHGDKHFTHPDLTEEEYFERFAELARRGRRFGVTLAQENVNLYRSADAAFLARMSDYLGDEAHYVLDIKQAVRAGQNPLAICEAMGSHVAHVHVNDHLPSSDCLLPGKGQMHFEELLALLKRFGYRGGYVIEVYRKSFSQLSELRASYHHMKNILTSAL